MILACPLPLRQPWATLTTLKNGRLLLMHFWPGKLNFSGPIEAPGSGLWTGEKWSQMRSQRGQQKCCSKEDCRWNRSWFRIFSLASLHQNRYSILNKDFQNWKIIKINLCRYFKMWRFTGQWMVRPNRGSLCGSCQTLPSPNHPGWIRAQVQCRTAAGSNLRRLRH